MKALQSLSRSTLPKPPSARLTRRTWISPRSKAPVSRAGSRSATWRTQLRRKKASNERGPGGPREFSLKRAAKLKQKKYRESEHLFLAEGRNFIEESPVTPVHTFTERTEVKRLSTLETPTGPVGVFEFLDVPVGELLQSRDRIVLLHGVQDPGNVGTVIRAAHAFGAGVALSKYCADLYNPKTVRATMGSIFHAPVAREIESVEFLEQARGAGFVSSAALPEGGELSRPAISGKSLIVVGTEGGGLPEEVEAACDKRVSIPAQAQSLNAAVAASILLYEAYGVC